MSIQNRYKEVQAGYLGTVRDDWRNDQAEHVFYQGVHLGYSLREQAYDAILADVTRLAEALEYYAIQENHEVWYGPDEIEEYSLIGHGSDSGERARVFLAAWKEKYGEKK